MPDMRHPVPDIFLQKAHYKDGFYFQSKIPTNSGYSATRSLNSSSRASSQMLGSGELMRSPR